MKKFLKISGCVLGGLLIVLYAAFLFVVPHVINPDTYKNDIQNLVLENTGLKLDYGKVKIITNPLLEAGVKIKDIKVSLPDGSNVVSMDSFKGKVFIPSILWRTVRVSCAKVVNPKLNIEILPDGSQFKAVRVYEDLVNERRKDKLLHPEKYAKSEIKELPIDISKIRINIPAVKLKNYSAVISDMQTTHKLTLKGEEVKLGYNNGEFARIKADAVLLNDDQTNITANVNIDTALPEIKLPEKEEEDLEAVYSIPFVNPVEVYRNYNLKSNVNSKLKIRKDSKGSHLNIKGFLNVDDTSITLSGLELPKSHFRLIAKGHLAEIDSNLYVTSKDYINLFGKINHGKKPSLDLTLKSTKIYLNNLLNVVKAYFASVNVISDIDKMQADGYFLADATMKTNFKKMESDGYVIVRGGKVSDSNIGLLFDDIKANIIASDNVINISNTHLLINNRPVDVSGKITPSSFVNLDVKGDKIPLVPLYKAFIPSNIKKNYNLQSGNVSLKANLNGDMKDLTAFVKTDVDNFILSDYKNLFKVINNNMRFGAVAYENHISAIAKNNGFSLFLPHIQSVIKSNNLSVDIDKNKIAIKPSEILFNNNSKIMISGALEDYLSKIKADFKAGGNIDVRDLGVLVGNVALPYYEYHGFIPVKALLEGKIDNMKIIAQAKSDRTNYFTPVNIKELVGNDTIMQLKLHKHGNTIKLEDSGIYYKPAGSEFGDNLGRNMLFAKELVTLKAIISNINFQPFISMIKLSIPHELEGSPVILKRTRFSADGNLFVYGKPSNPVIKGNFVIKNIIVPELYSHIAQVLVDVGSKTITFNANRINLNGSLLKLSGKTNWDILLDKKLYDIKLSSIYIDVNKVLKVVDAINKVMPSPSEAVAKTPGKEMNIPLEILSGDVRLRKIVMDKIFVDNTTADIALLKNIFYLNNLKTSPLGGYVAGKASMDLIETIVNTEVSGKNFDIEKILAEVLEMKDLLSGNMNFVAKLSLKGLELEQQLRSLQGTVDFNIKNGQLGPFGKLENFIMAENIRENAFFSSTIGSVITNLVTFDTSRYNELYGHLDLADGVAEVSPIKSQGNVMSMFIAGKVNLLNNTADLKVRGKLASAFSDKLGPLANLNPINIVKSTPGLNIVMVKAFALFCEEISEEEMKALPALGEGKSDDNATKFQIKLKGDTRKPLKMIKSFKWLALNSEMQNAKDFVDTLPTPEAGEEGMSVEELIELRKVQAQEKAAQEAALKAAEERKLKNRIKKFFGVKN